jgi:hypothetical protein
LRIWILFIVWFSAGCPSGEEPSSSSCLEPLDLQCAPLYTPDFDQVVRQTLMPKCGVGNGNCHDPSGGMGGLVITDFLPATHEALLVNDRVIPGDPECSLMIRSVEGHQSALLMPPGSPLSAEERCALIQWVASGAKFQP